MLMRAEDRKVLVILKLLCCFLVCFRRHFLPFTLLLFSELQIFLVLKWGSCLPVPLTKFLIDFKLFAGKAGNRRPGRVPFRMW